MTAPTVRTRLNSSWACHECGRLRVDALCGKEVACEGNVLTGVRGSSFGPDLGLRHTSSDGLPGVVHGLTVREAVERGWCVGSGEDDEREPALVVEVGGVDCDAEVVAAEPYGQGGRGASRLMLVAQWSTGCSTRTRWHESTSQRGGVHLQASGRTVGRVAVCRDDPRPAKEGHSLRQDPCRGSEEDDRFTGGR